MITSERAAKINSRFPVGCLVRSTWHGYNGDHGLFQVTSNVNGTGGLLLVRVSGDWSLQDADGLSVHYSHLVRDVASELRRSRFRHGRRQ